MLSEKKIPNRLINEKSPYLLQHAYNPVNWYPWGEEAFEKARLENKPVFLSIGYSTCHWCHVMSEESFEDEEVALLLNRKFVSVKVDREERPDVDAVYMSVCQALNGSGGWPLTIIMTPEQKPFFAATYIPKVSKYGRNGLMDILDIIALKWKEDKERLLDSGEQIRDYIKSISEQSNQSSVPTKDLLKSAFHTFLNNFDKRYGGFGNAPKFPTPHNLLFLLRYFTVESEKKALDMVEKTLLEMYKGGIFDHVGGGFSRYSTDEKWLVPHFEKMLYDNAGLSYVYLEAYQKTGIMLYRVVAERILLYVHRELTDENGGFYCSQDADSEGVEGKYYVFSPDEIYRILNEEDAEFFCKCFDITKDGNFEGHSIPNLIKNQEIEQADSTAARKIVDKVYDYRLGRTALHKDDKVLTSWNAFMIASFSKAYRVLGNETYLQAAIKAHKFIDENLKDSERNLWVRWREGEKAHYGQLDDYSFYAWSLLELYESTLEPHYLSEAIEIAKKMLDKFFDYDNGGFYLYANDARSLIVRPKEIYDGAMPSGNSVAAYVLSRLYKLSGNIYWQKERDRQFAFLAGNISSYPSGYSFSLVSLMEVLYPTKELVYVSKEISHEKIKELLDATAGFNMAILVKTLDNQGTIEKIAPFTKDYPIPDGGETYYLCENGSCRTPVTHIKDFLQMIKS